MGVKPYFAPIFMQQKKPENPYHIRIFELLMFWRRRRDLNFNTYVFCGVFVCC